MVALASPSKFDKIKLFQNCFSESLWMLLKGSFKKYVTWKKAFLSPLPRLLFPPFSSRPLSHLRRKSFCMSIYLSISHCIKRGTKGEELHSVYLSVFSQNAGKYGPEKTPYLDTFHAVTVLEQYIIVGMLKIINTMQKNRAK